MQVPRLRTPIPKEQLAEYMRAAYQRIIGRNPDRTTAQMLLMLLIHENAGGQSIYNYNWGNVIARRDGSAPWYLPQWYDPAFLAAANGATQARMAQMRELPNVPDAFRARSNHEEGADSWIRTLSNPTNRRMLKAARTGDVDNFWRAVSTPHPKTGAAYCPHCHTEATRDEYARIFEQVKREGFFSDLKAGPAAAGAAVARSSSSESAQPTS